MVIEWCGDLHISLKWLFIRWQCIKEPLKKSKNMTNQQLFLIEVKWDLVSVRRWDLHQPNLWCFQFCIWTCDAKKLTNCLQWMWRMPILHPMYIHRMLFNEKSLQRNVSPNNELPSFNQAGSRSMDTHFAMRSTAGSGSTAAASSGWPTLARMTTDPR